MRAKCLVWGIAVVLTGCAAQPGNGGAGGGSANTGGSGGAGGGQAIIDGGGGAGGGSVALKPQGASCQAASACESGFCVDGVCCGSACNGQCEACSAARTGAADGTCSPLPNGGVCRPAAGACDSPEVCTNGVCAADQFADAGTPCRSASGVCDVPEVCSGAEAQCPADAFIDAGVVCRSTSGLCDVAEACTGQSGACPADGFVSAGTTCRNSTGACDPAELCSGQSAACPSDAVHDAGYVCRAAAGACDVAEVCDGVASNCPSDAKRNSAFACRPAAGPCDQAESCDNVSNDCPVDTFVAASTLVCAPFKCTGSSAGCTTACATDSDCASNARSVCVNNVCRVAHLAFVTSLQMNSNFGGVAVADAVCQNLAADAGLGTNFKAWTSVSPSTSPATTFNRDAGLYIRMSDKARIATDWADLTDGLLISAISYTEKKTVPAMGTRHVFTGTASTGVGGLSNCSNWTVADAGVGAWGSCDTNQAAWTAVTSGTACSGLNGGRLYCFEQ